MGNWDGRGSAAGARIRRTAHCRTCRALLQSASISDASTAMRWRWNTGLGDSGLEVSPLCLGTMMFGDRTDAAASRADHRRRARRRRQLHRHRRRLHERRVRAHRRRGDQGASRATGSSRPSVGNVMTEEAARRRPVAALDPRRPATTASRASAPTTSTSTTCTRTIPTRRSPRPSARIGDLIRAGKIRYFGVSNYRGWRIAEVVAECEAQGVPRPSSASRTTTC